MSTSTLVYATSTEDAAAHRYAVQAIQRIHKAERKCPSRAVEPHLLGEFPMDCTFCHIEADS